MRGRPQIPDEFKGVPVDRRVRYQMRAMKLGLCVLCKKPVREGSRFCSEHHEKKKLWNKQFRENKKRERYLTKAESI